MSYYNETRWEAKKNIKFIHEYKLQKCLWDPNHPFYRNRHTREIAYKEIMEVMGMASVREVVARIRMLRNTLNNELHKAKKLQTNDKLPYKSKIRWLPHLDFIKNIDSGEKTENEAQCKPQICFVERPDSSASDDHQECSSPSTSRNKHSDKKHLLRAVEALEKVVTQSQLSTDEFDLFGRIVAQQLRHLPLETALETEEMVLAVIRNQRVKIANAPMPKASAGEDMSIVKVEESWWEASPYDTKPAGLNPETIS